MASMSMSHSRLRTETAWEFRLITIVGFAYFLVIACASRCLPRAWRPLSQGGVRRSVIEEARTATHTLIPFAFMQ